ncbi:hypothetical protein BSKO_06947 [Bryopsis sp. KO-2023]|nr:hypothetical protein BSKO_06947 [Bryopsis sp. KO-2023]
MHDRIENCLKQTRVREVFRKADDNRDGWIPTSAFKNCLERMRLVVTDEETERVLATMKTNENDEVEYEKYLAILMDRHTLGWHAREALDDNVMLAAPWEKVNGNFSQCNTNGVVPEAKFDEPAAEEGSFAEQASSPLKQRTAAMNVKAQFAQDERLLRLLQDKFRQHKTVLRNIFGRIDTDKNSLIDKHEFVEAVEKLQMAVSRPQIERFYDAVDRHGTGSVNYEQFMNQFDGLMHTRTKKVPPYLATHRKELKLRFAIGEEDEKLWERSPRLRELKDKLYRRSDRALDLFRAKDANMDGHLSIKELAKICSRLEPRMEAKELATLLVRLDPLGDGYISYREFLRRLCSYPPQHPRSMPRLNSSPGTFSGRELLGESCLFKDPPPRPNTEPSATEEVGKTNEHHIAAVLPLIDSLTRCGMEAGTINSNDGTDTLAADFALGTANLQRTGRHGFTPKPKNTWDVTKAPANTAAHIPDRDTFKRKKDGALTEVQLEDRHRKEQHRLRCKKRFEGKTSFEKLRSERDQAEAVKRDEARLNSLAVQKKRHHERMCLYNKVGTHPPDHTDQLFEINVM